MYNQFDQYIEFSEKINDFANSFIIGHSLTNVLDYDYSYVWDYVKSKDVKMRIYPFQGVANRIFSGFLWRDNLETTIAINEYIPSNRKNFTVSHEIVHYLYHLSDENHFFTDTEESLNYDNNALLEEFQANIGASVILIPDIVLFRAMQEGMSFNEISQNYGISESALYMRIIQMSQAYFQVSFNAAKKNADNIRYKRNIRTSRNYGKNFEEKVCKYNRFYEAL